MAKAQNGWRKLCGRGQWKMEDGEDSRPGRPRRESAIRGDRPAAVAKSSSLGLDQDLAANRGSRRQRRRLWAGAVEGGAR
jgi:hypothetical protein